MKIISLILLTCALAWGQVDYKKQAWTAHWISVPGYSSTEYGIYQFRKEVALSVVPESYVVYVSADNRYELYVNGEWIGFGPARGDISHWNYEEYDISPYLKPGKNWIAAKVWNEGEYRPEAQFSVRTGFLLQGVTDPSISTGTSWLGRRDESFAPLPLKVPFYYVAGPGEVRDLNKYTPDWETGKGEGWKPAQNIVRALPNTIVGPYGTTNIWMLQASILPPLERKIERLGKVVKAEGVSLNNFPKVKEPIHLPARKKVSLLLDQGYLTNAYPILQFSGGKGAKISLSYAEALYDDRMKKGNRNEVEGKKFIGRKDSLISAGRRGEVFRTYSYRTYRYLLMEVETQEEALEIEDLQSLFVGFPFQMKARMDSELGEMQDMLEVGWRTARLCAVDTYMDCPYYEQLQYIGDARIQALVSLYNSGDDRLLKNALNLMDQSRQPEGITLSRHPSYTPQYIPTFSLWYIGMLYDYLRYGSDIGFVKQKLSGVHQVLQYFQRYENEEGSLRDLPQWRFTDWVSAKDWKSGEGPFGADGGSAILDFQLLWAYQVAANLEKDLGVNVYREMYLKKAEKLKQMLRKRYWVAERGLFADRSEKDLYSQHANTLAILTETVTPEEAKTIARKLLEEKDLAPASIYFKYYLHWALVKAGRGEEYLSFLDDWRENLRLGLTTWAEMSDVSGSRSDCHAWGSSPNIEFYRILLGIDSDSPGFAKVKIQPHLGDLKQLSGEIPHPNGKISASYTLVDSQWKVQIALPNGVDGTFEWKGQKKALKPGLNDFMIKNSN
jgi:alpha-L-rhamnosidase